MVDVGRGAWSPWKTAPVMYLVCGCVALVCPGVNINKIEKRLVLIILVLVFKHTIKINKYMFV